MLLNAVPVGWELEGQYYYTKSMPLAPFWFKHNINALLLLNQHYLAFDFYSKEWDMVL